MRTVKIVNQVPTWCICYWEYGDDESGDLSEEDKRQFNEWLNGEKDAGFTGLWSPVEDEKGNWDEGFTSYPPFGLACDCVDVTMVYEYHYHRDFHGRFTK